MEQREKILVVDDDPDIVEAVRTILETKSYEVISASNGDEALRKVEEENPKLVILDIMMPKRDGFDVCYKLKNDPEYVEY